MTTVKPGKGRRRLDAEPFRQWLISLGKSPRVLARELGRDKSAYERVMNGRWKSIDYELAADAFERLHEPMQLHYDLAGELLERWCPTCSEAVTTSTDKICPWCEGKTASNDREAIASSTCPDCGGEKTPGNRGCMKCVALPRYGFKGMKISEELLRQAHRMYLDEGLSIPEVAAAIVDHTRYKNVRSAQNNIRYLFRRRGWEMRSRSEANRLKMLKISAGLPQCKHVKRGGKRCAQKTGRPSGYCGQHEPARVEATLKKLRSYPRRDRPAPQAELEPR